MKVQTNGREQAQMLEHCLRPSEGKTSPSKKNERKRGVKKLIDCKVTSFSPKTGGLANRGDLPVSHSNCTKIRAKKALAAYTQKDLAEGKKVYEDRNQIICALP